MPRSSDPGDARERVVTEATAQWSSSRSLSARAWAATLAVAFVVLLMALEWTDPVM